jgi:hypothetical protein
MRKPFTYLGIDQTGAVDSRGRPKPLPTAILRPLGPSGKYSLSTVWLPKFSAKSLDGLTNKPNTAIILLDCVLGLPARKHAFGEKPLRQAMNAAASHPGFGRKAASDFFLTVLENLGPGESLRACERIGKAMPVFLDKPFQRSIQAGAYRFWKDLGAEPEWCDFWPFTPKPQGRPILLESYASLFWRSVLGFPSRKPQELLGWLSSQKSWLEFNPQKIGAAAKDPNIADAIVLAVAGKILHEKHSLFQIPEGHLKKDALAEGWIAGLL